ncbi:MAG: hypothetical protein M3238_07765, partial [Actinomycetota bacterium]|nr:hypothetical protein [Actinomycetota bacterium]
MNGDHVLVLVTGVVIGAAICYGLIRPLIAGAPDALMRTNVSGRTVPAVLGIALAGASAAALLSVELLRSVADVQLGGMTLAVGGSLVVMALAGAWDDFRGDERPRGFSGHLAAARSRSLTGGLVK